MSGLQLAAPIPLSLPFVDIPFTRVLLGIDFGSASLAAARWATSYVAIRANAILSHVVPFVTPAETESAPDETTDTVRRMSPALTGGLGGFAATLAIASARNVVRVGRPSRWLSTIANAAQVSLMVLGRRADASRTRMGEPNVIERAARRTNASVLVVPEGTSAAPKHIVAAVDDSAFAPNVLRVARHLARTHEIPLIVIHVTSPAAGSYERVLRSGRKSAETGQRTLRPTEPAIPLGVEPTDWLVDLVQASEAHPDRVEVTTGDPAREITATAMTLASPLVVVGMRGADDAPRGSVGSVARELVTRAPVPVLAVNAR